MHRLRRKASKKQHRKCRSKSTNKDVDDHDDEFLGLSDDFDSENEQGAWPAEEVGEAAATRDGRPVSPSTLSDTSKTGQGGILSELTRVAEAFEGGMLSAFGDENTESQILARFQNIRQLQAELSMMQVQMLNDTTPTFRTSTMQTGRGLPQDLEQIQLAAADLSEHKGSSDKTLSHSLPHLGEICAQIDSVHAVADLDDDSDVGSDPER